MYLLDTNIWLERLLDQDRSEEVGEFLDKVPSDKIFITDFSFHSLSIVLINLDRKDDLRKFLRDAFIDGSVELVRLEPEDMIQILKGIDEFRLDFDDAYQYAASEKHGLQLISFDSDFQRVSRKAKSPKEALR